MKHPQAHIIEAYADTAFSTPLMSDRQLWMESVHFPGIWDRTHIEYVITHPEGNYAIGPRPASKERPVALKPGQAVYISVPAVGNFHFQPSEWTLMATMTREQLRLKVEQDFGDDTDFGPDQVELATDYILHRFLKDSK